MFEKVIDLHNLRENCKNKYYNERRSLIKAFIKKYKKEFPELCRYLYYVEYTYCKDIKRRKYKKSNTYIKDRLISYGVLYRGIPCKNCGKQSIVLSIPRMGILSAPLHTYCSVECRRAYSSKLGVRALSNLPLEKKREITRKMKQTMLKRYGATGTLGSKILYKKFQKTLQERYGVDFCSQNEDIKNRAALTFKKRYCKGSNDREQMLAKRRKTCLEKYGTEIPSHNKEIKKRISEGLKNRSKEEKLLTAEKTRNTNLKRYGVTNYNKLESAKENLRAKTLKRRSEGNINFGKSKIYYIGDRPIECQSKNEYEFAKWLVISNGYDVNNIISQYDPEYNDFIFNDIKTFPDFYLKDKDIYVEVKSPYTFFGTSKKWKYSEKLLRGLKEKAKRSNVGDTIVRWVVCNKLPNHIWHFAVLPKNWWEYPLEYFIKTFEKKKII